MSNEQLRDQADGLRVLELLFHFWNTIEFFKGRLANAIDKNNQEESAGVWSAAERAVWGGRRVPSIDERLARHYDGTDADAKMIELQMIGAELAKVADAWKFDNSEIIGFLANLPPLVDGTSPGVDRLLDRIAIRAENLAEAGASSLTPRERDALKWITRPPSESSTPPPPAQPDGTARAQRSASESVTIVSCLVVAATKALVPIHSTSSAPATETTSDETTFSPEEVAAMMLNLGLEHAKNLISHVGQLVMDCPVHLNRFSDLPEVVRSWLLNGFSLISSATWGKSIHQRDIRPSPTLAEHVAKWSIAGEDILVRIESLEGMATSPPVVGARRLSSGIPSGGSAGNPKRGKAGNQPLTDDERAEAQQAATKFDDWRAANPAVPHRGCRKAYCEEAGVDPTVLDTLLKRASRHPIAHQLSRAKPVKRK